jgi:fumarylacetoacetase
MLELSQGGQVPIELHGGENRVFIEDGDTITMKAWCEKEGAKRIGFGSVQSIVV